MAGFKKAVARRRGAASPPEKTPRAETLPEALAAAVEAGRYLVAVVRLAGGKLELFREARDFPPADVDNALDLLRRNCEPLRRPSVEARR